MQTIYVITIVGKRMKPTVLLYEYYEKAKFHYDEIIGFALDFGIEVYLDEETVIK